MEQREDNLKNTVSLVISSLAAYRFENCLGID